MDIFSRVKQPWVACLMLAVLVLLPSATFATNGGDECGETIEYSTKTDDFSDSRIIINYSNSDQTISVSAKTGYEIVEVALEVPDDGQPGFYVYATGPITNFNPPGSHDITGAKVKVKKTCPDVCPNIDGEQYTVPSGLQLIGGQCLTPPPDACGEMFSYTSSGDLSNARVTIDVSSNKQTVTITPKDGYVITKVELDIDGDGQSGYVDHTNKFPGTYNPSGNDEIDGIKVTVKKSCPDVCPNINGEQYTVPDGLVLDGGQCVTPPPVDVCPNVEGTQTAGPCADETCVADGGTWADNTCTISVDACPSELDPEFQASGPCNSDDVCPNDAGIQLSVDECTPPPPVDVCENVHGDQAEGPCADETCTEQGGIWDGTSCEIPPTPEEQCAIDQGFWNGQACEPVEECGDGYTYNSATNDCDEIEVPVVPTCETHPDMDECTETEEETGGGESPAPVLDVCPNVDGDQSEVPSGMTKNDAGECVPTSSGGGAMVYGSGPSAPGWTNDAPQGGMGGSPFAPSLGEVLGDVCAPLITAFLKMGNNNPVDQVEALQNFLNTHLGTSIPVTGFFGPMTFAAVQDFQVKYGAQVLQPWVPFGHPDAFTPTGYVYKTTKHQINALSCPALNESAPQLP